MYVYICVCVYVSLDRSIVNLPQMFGAHAKSVFLLNCLFYVESLQVATAIYSVILAPIIRGVV